MTDIFTDGRPPPENPSHAWFLSAPSPSGRHVLRPGPGARAPRPTDPLEGASVLPEKARSPGPRSWKLVCAEDRRSPCLHVDASPRLPQERRQCLCSSLCFTLSQLGIQRAGSRQTRVKTAPSAPHPRQPLSHVPPTSEKRWMLSSQALRAPQRPPGTSAPTAASWGNYRSAS